MQGPPVFQLQASTYIAQADAFRVIRQNFPEPFRGHADAIVSDLKAHFPSIQSDVDRHPATAGFFANLIPLFTALLSIPVLGEVPQLYHAMAFVLIVGGIVVSSRR